MVKSTFDIGQTLITPGAAKAFESNPNELIACLRRHVSGDWGELDAHDKRANNDALNPDSPQRILSAYTLANGVKVWIITEWDRSVTTILLPEEY